MTQYNARLAVRPETQQKAAILGSKAVRYNGAESIGDLIAAMVEDAWQEALSAGLVREAMLEPTVTCTCLSYIGDNGPCPKHGTMEVEDERCAVEN